jgi:lysophospholipid acyltransferase (LPLAT)-like uncharacterized protein
MTPDLTSQPKTKTAPQQSKPRSTVVHSARWFQQLGAWLIVVIEHLVSSTLRFKWRDSSGFFDQPAPEPAIYCLWHNRLALCMSIDRRYVRKRTRKGLAALVSASKDGAFLASILEAFDVQPVRGSSSRRGPQALLELQTWAEKGLNLAITPDGPRGPRYTVQDGAVLLAQITGFPIIPVSYHAHWKWTVKSWDRFQIPFPFSRCEIVYDSPIRIPRVLSDAEREQARRNLEDRMKAISKD